MNLSKSQTCSTVVHNVRSLLKSTEKELSSSSHTSDENEIKTTNKMIVSSNISSSSNKEENETRMGNKILKNKKKVADFMQLTDSQIELLVSTKKFSAQQILEWHQSFIRDHPSGKLDRKQFIEVYQQFYPHGKADAFCELAFKVCDQDKNGVVDFQEFLSIISMTMSGNIEERLNLAFAMYDINEDGLLDKKEITRIIKLIYEMNGHKYTKQDLSPSETAKLIINKFDTTGDRKLTRDEFVNGCLNNPELRKILTP